MKVIHVLPCVMSNIKRDESAASHCFRTWCHACRWLTGVVIPSTFPKKLVKREVSYALFNYSQGNESAEGRWAFGPSMDGEGVFNYVEYPLIFADKPKLKPAPPEVFNTPLSVLKDDGGMLPPSYM